MKRASSDTNFGYSFPAIRGMQARREYYVSMCPVRLIPRIFLFNSEELPPYLRVQRRLNRTRLPEITNYITNNPEDYVLSAITASIDGKVSFTPFAKDGIGDKVGTLNIDMGARFIINDGQHRRAAIEKALEEQPELGNETIAVVFFLDPSLKRCQQMFADLNRYAIRPSASLGILYDHRDVQAMLAKRLMDNTGVFKGLIETERTTLSARSRRLFTLSAIYGATNELLEGMGKEKSEQLTKIAGEYWESLSEIFKEWKQVYDGKATAGEIRHDFIHTHGVVLHALGRGGNALLHEYPKGWKRRLPRLGKIDWRRDNSEWEGRAMIGGRVSKNQHNVLLVTNVIKKTLGISLSPEEARAERAFNRGMM